MPRHRVLKVKATTPPRHRVLKIKASGESSTLPRHRVLNVKASGPLVTGPKHRVLKIEASGPSTLAVAPIPTINNVEPETMVSVEASLISGGPADSWSWRVVSVSPASAGSVSFLGSGASRQFRAPSALSPQRVPVPVTVVLGVTAIAGSSASPEQTVTININPNLEWFLGAGSQLIPSRPEVDAVV